MKSIIAPSGLLQEKRRRRAPQVSHNPAVETSLRQLKQTRFRWPFSSWRAIATPRISKTTLTDFVSCHSIHQHNAHIWRKIWKKSIVWRSPSSSQWENQFFQSLRKEDALQIFKSLKSLSTQNLGEILSVFRKRCLKLLSRVTSKHKFQKLVFNTSNEKLVQFFDKLRRLAKQALRIAAQGIIEQIIYAEMAPHLLKSLNQAHLENCKFEQLVTHLEKELQLNSLEAPDELQRNTVSQCATKTNADKPKLTSHYRRKNLDITETDVSSRKKTKGTSWRPSKEFWD